MRYGNCPPESVDLLTKGAMYLPHAAIGALDWELPGADLMSMAAYKDRGEPEKARPH
jgi:hypothetical protein